MSMTRAQKAKRDRVICIIGAFLMAAGQATRTHTTFFWLGDFMTYFGPGLIAAFFPKTS